MEEQEKTLPVKTKREITRGKKVHLPKSNKMIASGILDKGMRRHYINMCLDAIITARSQPKKKEQVEAV